MEAPSKGLQGFYREGSIFVDYLERIEGVTEAPLRYHLGTMLAVLGAVLGRKAVLRVGPHRLYTITPLILVGPSGIGKGEAIGVGRRLLKTCKAHVRENKMLPGMWIIQDEATPSALIKAFTVNPQGEMLKDTDPAEVAIIAGEMATFMSKTGEKEGMVAIVTKLLEQDDSYTRTLVKDMKEGQTQSIKDPTLSFIAGTTVDWMRKLMPSEMFAGGFFRRCIMVLEHHKGESLDWPVPLIDKDINNLAARWKRKLFTEGPFHDNHNKSSVVFDIENAKPYWKAWKQRHDKNAPGDPRIIGHYHSMPQHVLRSACSFAAAQGRLVITPDDLRDGEAWVESLMPDLQEILLSGEVHGFPDQCQLIERLLIRKPRMGYKELWNEIRVPKQQFDAVLEWAKNTDLIKKVPGDPASGEPGRVYTLTKRKRGKWERR